MAIPPSLSIYCGRLRGLSTHIRNFIAPVQRWLRQPNSALLCVLSRSSFGLNSVALVLTNLGFRLLILMFGVWASCALREHGFTRLNHRQNSMSLPALFDQGPGLSGIEGLFSFHEMPLGLLPGVITVTSRGHMWILCPPLVLSKAFHQAIFYNLPKEVLRQFSCHLPDNHIASILDLNTFACFFWQIRETLNRGDETAGVPRGTPSSQRKTHQGTAQFLYSSRLVQKARYARLLTFRTGSTSRPYQIRLLTDGDHYCEAIILL